VRGYDLVHSIDITNEKMINLMEAKVDALTEVCPFCLPVLHYCELLGLAQGMSPQELALDLHAVSCEPFLQKVL